MSETPEYYPLPTREEMMRDLVAMNNECDLVEARLSHCAKMGSHNTILEALRDTLAYKRAIREEIRTRLFIRDLVNQTKSKTAPGW